MTHEEELRTQRRIYRWHYAAMVLSWIAVAGLHGMMPGAVMISFATWTHRKHLRLLEARHPYARLLK